MSRRDDWDYEDDGEHVGGRNSRDYYNKYRHKLYEIDDDEVDEEYYSENSVVYDDEDEEY